MRPGTKTTEFAMALAYLIVGAGLIVFGALLAVHAIGDDQSGVGLALIGIGAGLAGITGNAYIKGRSEVKVAAIESEAVAAATPPVVHETPLIADPMATADPALRREFDKAYLRFINRRSAQEYEQIKSEEAGSGGSHADREAEAPAAPAAQPPPKAKGKQHR